VARDRPQTKSSDCSRFDINMSVFTGRGKIVKANGAEPDEFEVQVAQELFNLEMSAAELRGNMKDLYICAAKEIEVESGRKAIVIFVPYKQLNDYRKIQTRLVNELEKKLTGRHVILVAQRTILPKSYARSSKTKAPRSRTRTLTSVQEAILDDICYPTEISGKRIRFKTNGTKMLKCYLSAKDHANVETKVDTFSAVYRALTNKDVVFEFPVE
jgi:small subunit ribosomal protein S7e